MVHEQIRWQLICKTNIFYESNHIRAYYKILNEPLYFHYKGYFCKKSRIGNIKTNSSTSINDGRNDPVIK